MAAMHRGTTFIHILRGGLRPIVLAALTAFAVCGPAQAETRVALVIGNSNYQSVARLDNPRNDARLIADTLKSLGFTLVGNDAQLDLDKPGLDRAVRAFGTQLAGADVALFYYAGHGVQVRGANYLVPVDANPTREADVDFQMLDTNLVLRQMEGAGTKLNLVILDACRNNPFGGRGLRAGDGGLAQMRAPEGTLISFATQPGNVARDGTDGNSPYTKALAQTLRKPGLGIFETVNEVGLLVKRTTGGAQEPWFSSSPIDGKFFFNAAPVAPAAAAPQAAAPVMPPDVALWAIVRNSDVAAVHEEFVRKFPASAHAAEARARIDELKKSQVAVVAPPVTPTVPSAPSRSPCSGIAPLNVSFASRTPQPLSIAEECALKPGDVFKECSTCPEMVVLPAGSFTMGGAPKNEKVAPINNEDPAHTVTFAKPFAVGKLEVTVDQFAAFVKDIDYDAVGRCWTTENAKYELRSGRSWRNPGFKQNGSHPAVCVNWNDAKAYVARLTDKAGKPYRLLSESEWEYAARGQTSAGPAPRYPFGDDATKVCQYGNVGDQTAKSTEPFTDGFVSCRDGFSKTAPVGNFLPNAFGLHDMVGNAGEWTEDCRHSGYAGAPSDGSAWIAGGDCNYRMVRSGSWIGTPSDFRSTARASSPLIYGNQTDGFRVARTLAR
jgi:formylglycine-generating enzyme required for sulfatase activity/uncharacterized caspase-like protein